MNQSTAIVFENVTFGYAKEHPVLAQLQLAIPAGQFIGIAGCNGAGKSTMLRLMNVLLRPQKGTVYLNGVDTRQLSPAEAALHVGTVFQNPNHQLFLETVEEEIAYGLINCGIPAEERAERIQKALEVTGLLHLRQAFPRALSLGVRQRIALASVLALNPAIILLDEPTTGMDCREIERLMQILADEQARGKTVIMITHDLEVLLDHAERVILLAQGQILCDGHPRDVFCRHDDVLQAELLPPDMVRLTYNLREYGIVPTCSLEEAAEQVAALLATKEGDRLAG